MRIFTKVSFALTPALAMVGIMLFWSPGAVATPEIGEKVKKECTVCHTAEGEPDLNETGKYYQKNKKLPPAPKK